MVVVVRLLLPLLGAALAQRGLGLVQKAPQVVRRSSVLHANDIDHRSGTVAAQNKRNTANVRSEVDMRRVAEAAVLFFLIACFERNREPLARHLEARKKPCTHDDRAQRLRILLKASTVVVSVGRPCFHEPREIFTEKFRDFEEILTTPLRVRRVRIRKVGEIAVAGASF